ncbi:hypothetical protein MHU86_19469 [Fragilaria crotonensis]|nr:hypothetical protein MHU86_19469 [Fragilaria crotonensis]
MATDEGDEWTEPSLVALQRCKELNINFLAIDFDKTIMEIHTGACWKQSAQELLPYVRPMFSRLIPLAIDEGIHVAVVTFSSKTEMVRHILEHITDRAAEIPIRGGFPGSRTFMDEGLGSTKGKQAHMASAVEELEKRHKGLEITNASTLLIDDDAKNIQYALQHGVRAIQLNPNESSLLLKEMEHLV